MPKCGDSVIADAGAFGDGDRACRVSPAARLVVAAMTATGHTIGDPADAGVLNVAGLDPSLPLVVNGFIRS